MSISFLVECFFSKVVYFYDQQNSNFFGVLNFPEGASCTSTKITFGIKSPIIEAFNISLFSCFPVGGLSDDI